MGICEPVLNYRDGESLVRTMKDKFEFHDKWELNLLNLHNLQTNLRYSIAIAFAYRQNCLKIHLNLKKTQKINKRI